MKRCRYCKEIITQEWVGVWVSRDGSSICEARMKENLRSPFAVHIPLMLVSNNFTSD